MLTQSKKNLEQPEFGNDQTFDLEMWLNNFGISNLSNEESKDEDDYITPFVVEEGEVFSSQDFITALIKLNRIMYTKDTTPDEKRKILFGVDQIIP